MANEEHQYEQIEQYLDNTMSAEARQKFEQNLQADPALAVEVQLHREVDTAVRFAEEDQAFRNMLKGMKSERETPVRSLPRRRLLRIVSAAAAVLILVVALSYLFQNNASPQDLALQYTEINPISLTEKGASSEETLQQAESLFNQAKYTEASPFFDQYLQRNPDSFDVQLYGGISHMMEGQYAAAISSFNLILGSQALNRNEAQWYKALCLLHTNEVDQAKTLLRQLQESGSKKWSTKASDLLNELD